MKSIFLLISIIGVLGCAKKELHEMRPGEALTDAREVASELFQPLEDVLADAWPEVHDSTRSTYGEPLTEEKVRQVEEELSLLFPQSYVDLMMAQNGGHLRIRWEGIDEERYTDMEDLRPLDARAYGEHQSAYMINEWDYPSPAYWLGGDGHTAILLDYRGLAPDEEPQVLYIDLEANPPKEEVIFPNFNAFVNYLLEQLRKEGAE